MPRGNKTGPDGEGSMTGRAQGYCTGNNQPGFISNQSFQRPAFGGRGRGRGLFGGRGNRGGFRFGSGQGLGFRQGQQNQIVDNDPAVSEKTLIENDIRVLKDQLAYLEKQLAGSKNN